MIAVVRKEKHYPLGRYPPHEVQPFENSYSFFLPTDCTFIYLFLILSCVAAGQQTVFFFLTIEMILVLHELLHVVFLVFMSVRIWCVILILCVTYFYSRFRHLWL